MASYTFKASDNKDIHLTSYVPDCEVKYILHIVHGMTEHMGRYESLSEKLAESGVLTIGADLRGHGKNEGSKSCASMGKDGWESTLKDLSFINKKLKEKYPGTPLIMMGFSLGSFILRDFLSYDASEVSGAVIAGSGTQPSFILKMLKKLTEGEIKKAGFDDTTPLVKKLSFQTYNNKFKPFKTSADWLCSDQKEVDRYLNDTLCKSDISAGLFYQLLYGMQKTDDMKIYKNLDRAFPLLLISGSCDPVGNEGKGVEKLFKKLKKAGFKNVSLTLLPGARHDIFHENESGMSEKAYRDILDFILKIK